MLPRPRLGCAARCIALALALAVAVSACGLGSGTPPPLPGGSGLPPVATLHSGLVPYQISVGSMTRKYLLYVPPGIRADSKVPLVIALASGAATDTEMVQVTQFDPVADAHHFLVAYPAGFEESWNAGYCCAGARAQHIDDVGFISDLIHHLVANYPVASGEVYLTGASAGAIMAYWFACHQASMVAGVGVVAGAMRASTRHASRPVPVLEVHGTADPELPFNGGRVPVGNGVTALEPSTISIRRRWAQLDGCGPEPATRTVGVVSTSTWAPCQNGYEVKLVAVKGGGHTWFAPGFGPVGGAVNATALIWQFFSSLPRGTYSGT